VHDNVAQVDQYPRAVGVALHSRKSVALAADGFDDGVGDRARLNLRPPRYDREGVGQDRSPADVDCGKGFAFFVERAIADDVD
jgi:hypothetical protein